MYFLVIDLVYLFTKVYHFFLNFIYDYHFTHGLIYFLLNLNFSEKVYSRLNYDWKLYLRKLRSII